jgi:uncharacterized metal-binding protein
MAMGKTHDWVTLACLPSVWLIAQWGFHWPWHICALVTLGTYVGGFWLSPDLDTRSRPFYRWGYLRFIWWPYQWLAKHRSSLSHGLVFAAWLRLSYLSAVLILLYSGTSLCVARLIHSKAAPQPQREMLLFLQHHLHNILWLGLGVWLGSLIHILLDHVSSACKKWVRRR